MRKLAIFKEFTFDSAHRLPCVPEGHKCSNLHGHTWKILVGVMGPTNSRGWILDFGDLKKAVDPILKTLDHAYLNEIPGLENPTSELMTGWFWDRLQQELGKLHSGVEVCEITIFETPTSFATLRSE